MRLIDFLPARGLGLTRPMRMQVLKPGWVSPPKNSTEKKQIQLQDKKRKPS